MRTYPLFISIAFATTCAASTSSHAVTTNAVTVTSDTPALPTRKLASGDEMLTRSNLRSAYGFSDLNDKDEARMMSVQVAHEIPSVLPAAKQIEIEAGMAKMHTKLPEEEMNLLVNAVVNREPIKLQDFQKNALEDRLVEKVDSAVMPYDDLMLETKLTTYSNNEELLKDITTVLPKAAKGDKHNPQATVRALLEEDSLQTTNKIEESAERTELLKSFPKLEYAPSLTTETLQNMKTLLNRAEKETTGRKVGDKSKPDGLSRNPSSEVSHVGRQDDAVNIFNGRVLGSTIPLSLNAENKLVVAMISPTTLDKYVPMLPKGGLLEKESSLGGSLREVKEEAGLDVVALREFKPMFYKNKAKTYEMRPSVGVVTAEHKAYSEDLRSRFWVPISDFLVIAKGSKQQPMYGLALRLEDYIRRVQAQKTNVFDKEVTKVTPAE